MGRRGTSDRFDRRRGEFFKTPAIELAPLGSGTNRATYHPHDREPLLFLVIGSHYQAVTAPSVFEESATCRSVRARSGLDPVDAQSSSA